MPIGCCTRRSTAKRPLQPSSFISSSSKPSTSSSLPAGYVPTSESVIAFTLQFGLHMATFDQLSDEQRAIVELVLRQGKSYDELADMLGLPEARVRELARDALVDLAPITARGVEEDWRGQLADYVLGQQAGPEATATRGHLRRSEAARSWTRSLLDSLEQLYPNGDLPAIPDGERGSRRAAAAPRAAGSDPSDRGPFGPGSAAERAGRAYLRMRGHEGGCLAIVGFEGDEDDVERRRLRTGALLRAGGGVQLGRRPGEAWLRGRYAGPYLRDALLDHGAFVETLETATSWSNLPVLYAAVADALRRALTERGTPPLIMCHVSHLYRSGASLYYTFMARQEPEAALDQWWSAKSAACEAIVAHGGTITHHHAIGRDHARWLPAEVGDVGVDLIRAAKDRLDPAGIMNPGKLLP